MIKQNFLYSSICLKQFTGNFTTNSQDKQLAVYVTVAIKTVYSKTVL